MFGWVFMMVDFMAIQALMSLCSEQLVWGRKKIGEGKEEIDPLPEFLEEKSHTTHR
jgi:hypothetical protein